MSLVELLDNLFIKSLLLIYDGVFTSILAVVGNVGAALICFSLAVNLALMPIYYQMERAKGAGAQRRDEMDKEVARMKAHYTGRERYFYIRTVHRTFGYHPIAAVFGSSDLYLQVLVFASVYRYLAGSHDLIGASFLTIGDLSKPDGVLFGVVNLLPILMTLLNMLSTILYTEDKAKQRTGFAIAGLFLVLLYRSPSGVVLYWACNNAFSLARNYVQRRVVPALPSRTIQRFSRLANQE